MADRGLDAGLDRPAQRPVLQAAPGPPDIVGAVDPEKRSVSPVAQVSEEDEVLRHRVEHVAVEHEIAAPDALVHVLVGDQQVLEFKREELGEDVVVVSPEVHDLRVPLLEHLQHDSDEVGVRLRPLPVSPQLPAVDDVAVQDEFLAADVPEKVVHLGDLGINGSQVDVGYDDGPYAESFHGNCRANPAAERSSAGTIAAQSAGTINLRLRGRTSTSTLALAMRSEEHTSELQSPCNLVCRLLLA